MSLRTGGQGRKTHNQTFPYQPPHTTSVTQMRVFTLSTRSARTKRRTDRRTDQRKKSLTDLGPRPKRRTQQPSTLWYQSIILFVYAAYFFLAITAVGLLVCLQQCLANSTHTAKKSWVLSVTFSF